MRIKADTDKKEAALAEASMQSIEAAARKAYEKDLAAQQACAQANGDWVSLLPPWSRNCLQACCLKCHARRQAPDAISDIAGLR